MLCYVMLFVRVSNDVVLWLSVRFKLNEKQVSNNYILFARMNIPDAQIKYLHKLLLVTIAKFCV